VFYNPAFNDLLGLRAGWYLTTAEDQIARLNCLRINRQLTRAFSTTTTMTKQAIFSKTAPPPLPIYSQAIKTGNLIFCSGQVPASPETKKIIEGGIVEHTHQCIKNLGEVLKAAGSSLEQVVKVNVYLSDMDNFSKMNEVYITYFGDVKPARTCVAVKALPLGVDVEIECIAEA